jgi:hypothetical protein
MNTQELERNMLTLSADQLVEELLKTSRYIPQLINRLYDMKSDIKFPGTTDDNIKILRKNVN